MKATRDGRTIHLSEMTYELSNDYTGVIQSCIKEYPNMSIQLSYTGDSNASKAVVLDNVIIP